MTVCIAAMAMGLWKDNKKYPFIIGASDRMITAGDIEYEPSQSKIHRITPFIVALPAGDDALQAKIVRRTKTYFYRELANNPRFFSVEEVAELYSRNLVEHTKQTIERTVKIYEKFAMFSRFVNKFIKIYAIISVILQFGYKSGSVPVLTSMKRLCKIIF